MIYVGGEVRGGSDTGIITLTTHNEASHIIFSC